MKAYNRTIGLFFISLSLFIYLTAEFGMSGVTSGRYDPGAAVFPKVLAWIAIFLAGMLLIQTSKRDFHTSALREVFEKEGFMRVLKGVACCVLYFAAVSVLGFVVATLAFLFGFTRFLGIESVKKCAMVSIAGTFVVYYVFQVVLRVQLPGGIWG